MPVRLLHRTAGERAGGLGGAVKAGLGATEAAWAVVMDGDLQHPPEAVATMLAAARSGTVDVVVGSRYCGNGNAEGLSSRFRGVASRGATTAAKVAFPQALAGVTDPMSGFFALRTSAVDADALRPRGFKILLEILARTPRLRVAEVPFAFAQRHAGHSKASGREAARYLRQLAALRIATAGEVGRLLRFALVGASGVGINLLVLAALLQTPVLGGGSLAPAVAETIATQLAIAWNFGLTERLVFASAGTRYRRWLRFAGFWGLSNGSLAVQLPLADAIAHRAGSSYVVATAVTLALLVAARYAACRIVLYRPARRPPLTRLIHRPSRSSAVHASEPEAVA
jgi:dolichol-phosphate mannosyltransferase